MYVVKVPRSKFYQLVYFIDAKRKTISTRKTNKKDAYEFLINFQKQLDQPVKKTAVSEESSSDQILLEDFGKEYEEYSKSTKSVHYVESIVSSFSHLIQTTGNISLTEINLRLLDNFFTLTYQRTPHGAHHFYRTLKAAFTKAVDWEYLEINPFTKIKLPRLPKVNPIFIGVEELKVILSQTKESTLRDLFKVAFYTGMRLIELTNMKSDWINKSSKTILVKCSKEFTTKSKKERIIPINSNLESILLTRSWIDGYIFKNRKGKMLCNDFVSKKFKQSVRSARLNERIHFHTLRHSFASQLVQNGVSLFIVKELLGHGDIKTTQIYSHLQTKNLFDAVEVL